MRIAVVLCTYNGQKYLRDQLDSILAQTRLPDAMLVQDDASKDATVSILETYADKAPFELEIIRNGTNLGFVRNFEQAIARCSADVIVLSDQDDYWRRDRLQITERVFEADDKACAVFSDAEMVDDALGPLGDGLLEALNVTKTELAGVRARRFLPVLLRRNLAAGATMAFRADWRDRFLPIPGGPYHDEWIALVSAAFDGLRYIPEALIKYRQHASNQLGARRPTATERLLAFLQPQANMQFRATENLRRLKVIEALAQRLDALGAHAPNLAEVNGKLQHVRARTSLPGEVRRRLPIILDELWSGRYGKYSSGLRTAIRDVLFPVLL